MYNGRKISLIVATDSAGGIGYKNKLPWEPIPEDMKWFKQKTTGHIVIMGRKTAESIGGRLKGRENIVITSRVKDSDLDALWGCNLFSGLEGALDYLNEQSLLYKIEREIFIIGGAQLYRSAMDMDIVDTIWQTVVNQVCKTDTSFEGPHTLKNWKLTTLMSNKEMYRIKYTRKDSGE